ncbi:MAG TPA: flavodoxin domain-containing protein [Thermoanaerobaculia bacterium]
MRLLILYSSKHGQTEKIAQRIAEIARREGHAVAASPVASLQRDVRIGAYDSVIIAAPVYFGRFPKATIRFVARHFSELSSVRTALVAVSLAAKFNVDEAESQVHKFVGVTGWLPATYFCVAGAEAFTKYGLFTRFIMKKIARDQGRGGDFSKDREYTDWEALERFAREFVAKEAVPTSSTVAVQP